MNVCIIPARSGSRRIPGKNIKHFMGKPIIAYSINTAIESKIFDRVIVSTDSEEIANVARQYGAEVIMRSEEMSRDEVGTQEVIAAVIQQLRPYICRYVCCLYPCAPMLHPRTLCHAYAMLKEDSYRGYVVPVGTWLRDPGQFYFGREEYFGVVPLNADCTTIVKIPENTECDINTMSDWKKAEKMYLELHKEKACI